MPQSILPSALQGRAALACVIRLGRDGKLYAATGIRNQFLKIDPTTKNITVFNTNPYNPLGNLQPFNDAWEGPTGVRSLMCVIYGPEMLTLMQMYFSQTTGNVISLFDYETEQFTNYEIPTPLAAPLGMRLGSDGALWFTEFLANKIGRLDITTGNITEYDLPAAAFGPAVMRAETEGRYLWFTALLGNGIGRIDEQTGEAVAFTNPTPLSLPAEDDQDSDGNICASLFPDLAITLAVNTFTGFSTITENRLNYYTPSTGRFTSVSQPDEDPISLPVSLPPAGDLAMHYQKSSNSMWFTELLNNRVGRYALD